MTTYQGSCHCGAIKYEVTADIKDVISCNCSHCGRKGFLLTFVSKDAFKNLTPEAVQTEYLFNKHAINHLFCPTCGVESFAYGKNPDGSEAVAINVRTIPDLDLESLNVMPYDGKSM